MPPCQPMKRIRPIRSVLIISPSDNPVTGATVIVVVSVILHTTAPMTHYVSPAKSHGGCYVAGLRESRIATPFLSLFILPPYPFAST
jgi:hypothetical protein